ncbi:MAG: divalent cation tolerance protein CutA [Bryobacteraceae bacterium]
MDAGRKIDSRPPDRLAAELKRLHSYQLPEIVAVPVIAGSLEYLDWIDGAIA